MQASQDVYLLGFQALDARIGRMHMQRHLVLGQPLAQRFGINGKQLTALNDGKTGHAQRLLSRNSNDGLGEIQGKLPGTLPGGEQQMTMVRRAEVPLPCGTTMSGVEEAGTTLMAASPPRPGKQQCRTPRRREDEVSQQMAHFGNGQRKQRAGWRCSFYLGRLSGEPALRSTNACKTCLNDHDERNISIPGGEAPDFVIGEPHFFPSLETFFNFP